MGRAGVGGGLVPELLGVGQAACEELILELQGRGRAAVGGELVPEPRVVGWWVTVGGELVPELRGVGWWVTVGGELALEPQGGGWAADGEELAPEAQQVLEPAGICGELVLEGLTLYLRVFGEWQPLSPFLDSQDLVESWSVL